MRPQVKECWPHRKLDEAKQGLSSRASGGSTALPTPRFGTPGPQNYGKTGFRCFKLPRLWWFVSADLGN